LFNHHAAGFISCSPAYFLTEVWQFGTFSTVRHDYFTFISTIGYFLRRHLTFTGSVYLSFLSLRQKKELGTEFVLPLAQQNLKYENKLSGFDYYRGFNSDFGWLWM
jgi:hypothetical protein